jgi:hypothetical protein
MFRGMTDDGPAAGKMSAGVGSGGVSSSSRSRLFVDDTPLGRGLSPADARPQRMSLRGCGQYGCSYRA